MGRALSFVRHEAGLKESVSVILLFFFDDGADSKKTSVRRSDKEMGRMKYSDASSTKGAAVQRIAVRRETILAS